MKKGAVILFLSLLTFSCSGKPPAVLEVYHTILVEEDLKASLRYETLILYAHVEDPDGIEDLESIYCIADDPEFYVQLDASSWRKIERDGETWLGSGSIVMPDRSDLPRADYRLIVIDSNGERSEGEFSITAEHLPKGELNFPFLRIGEGFVEVAGGEKRYVLSAYGVERELLFSAVVSPGRSGIADLASGAEAAEKIRSFYIQSTEEKAGYGLRSGPYEF